MLSPVFNCCQQDCENRFTHISLGNCACIFIGHIPKSVIMGQRVCKLCRQTLFINNAKLVSKNTFTNLHSVQQYMRLVFSPPSSPILDSISILNICHFLGIKRIFLQDSCEEKPIIALLKSKKED